MRIDKHAAALLSACGYFETRYEAHWEDIGGPENGPELQGHPAYAEWMLIERDTFHSIIVVDGEVVDVSEYPIPC